MNHLLRSSVTSNSLNSKLFLQASDLKDLRRPIGDIIFKLNFVVGEKGAKVLYLATHKGANMLGKYRQTLMRASKSAKGPKPLMPMKPTRSTTKKKDGEPAQTIEEAAAPKPVEPLAKEELVPLLTAPPPPPPPKTKMRGQKRPQAGAQPTSDAQSAGSLSGELDDEQPRPPSPESLKPSCFLTEE